MGWSQLEPPSPGDVWTYQKRYQNLHASPPPSRDVLWRIHHDIPIYHHWIWLVLDGIGVYPFLDNMEAIQSRQMEPNSDVGLQQPRQSNWERFILGLTMQKLQVYNHYRIVYIIIVHMSSLPLNMKPEKRWFRRGCNHIFQTIQCFFSLGHGNDISCTYQSSLYACIHNYTYTYDYIRVYIYIIYISCHYIATIEVIYLSPPQRRGWRAGPTSFREQVRIHKHCGPSRLWNVHTYIYVYNDII